MKCTIILNPATMQYHWATIQSDGKWFISSTGYDTKDKAIETAVVIYKHIIVKEES